MKIKITLSLLITIFIMLAISCEVPDFDDQVCPGFITLHPPPLVPNDDQVVPQFHNYTDEEQEEVLLNLMGDYDNGLIGISIIDVEDLVYTVGEESTDYLYTVSYLNEPSISFFRNGVEYNFRILFRANSHTKVIGLYFDEVDAISPYFHKLRNDE